MLVIGGCIAAGWHLSSVLSQYLLVTSSLSLYTVSQLYNFLSFIDSTERRKVMGLNYIQNFYYFLPLRQVTVVMTAMSGSVWVSVSSLSRHDHYSRRGLGQWQAPVLPPARTPATRISYHSSHYTSLLQPPEYHIIPLTTLLSYSHQNIISFL